MAGEREIHQNPVCVKVFLWLTSIPFFAVIISSLWIYVEDGSLDLLAIIINCGLFLAMFLALPWNLELYHRPTRVEIADSGVVLHLRYSKKQLFIPWSGIKYLNIVIDADPKNAFLSYSCLKIMSKKEKGYFLTWKIGMAIRESYRMYTGQYPINQSQLYDKQYQQPTFNYPMNIQYPSQRSSEGQPSQNIENRFCIHCGKQIPLDSRFCQNCGKEVK